MAYIEFDHVVKEYPSGSSVIRALDEASFTAEQGELSVILGQSGAGKTTALNILGGMDTATTGRVVVGGRDITGLRKKELVTYRRNDIGFVFQFYNLVPNLTALENVELDYETGKEVLQLLQDICQTQGMTVMIITHNSALAPMAHKVIRFRSGKVTSEEVNATPRPIADIEW